MNIKLKRDPAIDVYLASVSTLKTLAKEIAAYTHTKSALHFGQTKPLPATLIRNLLKMRMAERS